MSTGTLTSNFKNIIKRSGLPKVRLRDLRPTHATRLPKAGVDPKIAQERLGHATIAVTLELDSQVMPGVREDAAMKVDRVLKSALGKLAEP